MLSKEELNSLLSEAGFSPDSEIGFEEFVQFYAVASLFAVFKSMDVDESGHVSAGEIKAAFLHQGVLLTDEQLHEMLRDVDKDDDGLLTFGEFRACFGRTPLRSMRELADRWSALSQVQLGSDLGMPSIPPDSVPLWRFVLAGGLGGAVGRVLLAPLERVQIMAQSGNLPAGKGPLAAARHIAAREGIGALWRGVTPSLLVRWTCACAPVLPLLADARPPRPARHAQKVFPFAGTVCLLYSQLLAASPADSELDPMEPVWRFAAGGLAGAVATTATYPLDLVRARMAVSGSPGAEVVAPGRPRLGLLATASSVVRQQGAGGLFRGVRGPAGLRRRAPPRRPRCLHPSAAARPAPTHPLRNGALHRHPAVLVRRHQSCRRALPRAQVRGGGSAPHLGDRCGKGMHTPSCPDGAHPGPRSVPLYAACGLTAGLLAQTAVYPLEVIRRRAQTASLAEKGRTSTGVILRSLQSVRAQGGARALFAGLSTTYLKVMPNVAIGLVVRDAVLGRLSKGPS